MSASSPQAAVRASPAVRLLVTQNCHSATEDRPPSSSNLSQTPLCPSQESQLDRLGILKASRYPRKLDNNFNPNIEKYHQTTTSRCGDMNTIRRLNINHRLLSLILLAVIGISTTGIFSLIELQSSMMGEKELQTRKLVEVAHSILAEYYGRFEKGELKEQDAKEGALQAIKAIRFDGGNYFWINDMTPRMVMHPIKPKLDGQDLSSFEDPSGARLFNNFVNQVSKNGEGVVPYLWPKPGSEQPEHKVSYVKGFAPWGWIVGTGIYIDDVDAAFWQSAIVMAIISGLVLAVLLASSFIITRSIVKPLKQAVVAMRDIAEGDGDLTRRLNVEGSDEVAVLAASFNDYSERVQQLVIQVDQAGSQMAGVVSEVLSICRTSNQGVEQQRSETQQVATAVTQMAATVQDVAKNAEMAAASAGEANDDASSGQQTVKQTTSAIVNLAAKVEQASSVINRLESESESIGSVLDVIRGIAEQTNLLALNAAIEAARAGDQGRGFAVVADEVRTLAGRTQQSTEEIRKMIETLQGGAQEAVEVMNSSRETVQVTVDKAQMAGTSLESIVSSMAAISDMNAQIATAAEEQSAVAQEIDRSIVQLSELAGQAAEGSDAVVTTTQTLSELGDRLRSLIGQFKVS